LNLIKKGAEGDIFLTKYDGLDAVLKTRKKKAYRNPVLDERIRRQRTIREASIMAEAKSFGVPSPLVYFVDANECTILMQWIPGKTVKSLPPQLLAQACRQIGRITGALHKNGTVHGDLTTSNFIQNRSGIFAIDFGLAQKTPKLEDHAVDLRLFKEILGSEHVQYMEKLWTAFLRGYRSKVGTERYNRVLNHVSIIEGRGRYAQVV
jgi:TP53 regulating kinase and related kinases